MSRTTRLTTLLAVTAALVGSLSTAPVFASNSYNGNAYVNGSGLSDDDWDDEGVLSMTSNTRSNATCLWQKILWSNYELDWSEIDGVFGQKTMEATQRFQRNLGIRDDGIVGKESFHVAAALGLFTKADGITPDHYEGYDFTNDRSPRPFLISRDSDGHYTFYDRSGVKRAAGYNYLTCG